MSISLSHEISTVSTRRAAASGPYRLWGKRVLDFFAALALLPIAVPIIAVVWFLTTRDGGHGFYAQHRVGRDGKLFRCWKIRTMVRDADDVLARLIAEDPEIAREWHQTQKLHDDPRITRLGRLLRKTSIDELPQLWNVLKGDMSLIGPRPFTPDQKPLYDRLPASAAYYSLRPGISGLWQVDCRNDGAFDERAGYDDAYADGLSLWQDLLIVGRTIQVVCCATGK